MDGRNKDYYWDWVLLNKQLSAADFRCWQDVLMGFRLTPGWRHQRTSAAQAKAATVVLKQRNPALLGREYQCVRAVSGEVIVVASMLLPQSVDWNTSEGYRLSAITHTRAELQVLLVPLTTSDSAVFHQKWCKTCPGHESDDFLIVLLVRSLDFCSQIFDCSEYFESPVWLCLQELTVLANVRLWQARSLVTTIVPRGPLALSLPLKCVLYTVVDNKQKDG